MKTAASIGIPIPRTMCLQRYPGEQISAEKCRGLSYPVVVKPSRSCIKTDFGWHKSGVKYAVDESQLKETLALSAKRGEYPLLLQEKIRGEGVGVFLLVQKGETIAKFSHRRLREKPPSGGVSVLRESIGMDDELLFYSECLLKALAWEGVAMVEFKRDEVRGGFRLMEVNGRFWGSLQLAIDAGVNFPLLLAERAQGRHIHSSGQYKIGTRLRWLWGDADSLIAVLKGSDKRAQHTCGKLKSVLNFLRFFGKDLRYEVFDRDDMGPWIFETRNWLAGKS